MNKRPGILIVLTLLVCVMMVAAACGSAGDTGARDDGTSTGGSPSAAATGEPFRLGFTEGFTGFMALDASLVDHGIQVALDQAGNQVLGRPIEYIKSDNGSDPVQAVDKARQLVESDKINAMLGPMFSPSNSAVTDYLARNGGIPSISFMGQPIDNMKTANKLSFIPSGFFSMSGYYLGKYATEDLGYTTSNIIVFEDTASRQMVAGYKKAFTEGGGKILSEKYVPYDTMDFAAYLTTMPKADCTAYWIFGNASAPFIKGYREYGVQSQLLALQASCLTEQQLQDLGDLTLGIKGVEYYVNTIDNPLNKQFVEDYKAKWDGEYPNLNAWGGWFAVNLFLEGVKKTNGDTTPAKLIEAMSTATIDTPSGPVAMSAYKDAFIGTTNLYICEVQQGEERYQWVPIKTYESVKNVDVSDMEASTP